MQDLSYSLQSFALAGGTIELWVPDEDSVKQKWESGAIAFPYWSQVWPAAKALANYLLANKELIEGRSVLELAAGIGLPSFVAASSASSVTCSDHDADAVTLLHRNIEHLCLTNCKAAVLNWNDLHLIPPAEVILLSDINYEPAAFAALQQLIAHLLDQDRLIILSTPQRLVAKEFIESVRKWIAAETEVVVLDQGRQTRISVFILR